MRNISGRLRHIIQPASMLLRLIVDAVCYLGLCLRLNPKLAAEVLFLRKQHALYEERQANPGGPPTRLESSWFGFPIASIGELFYAWWLARSWADYTMTIDWKRGPHNHRIELRPTTIEKEPFYERSDM